MLFKLYLFKLYLTSYIEDKILIINYMWYLLCDNALLDNTSGNNKKEDDDDKDNENDILWKKTDYS